jgi:hypothetical protein
MFVGRCLCGLPISSFEFATLPPHFEEIDDEVTETIALVFPNAPKSLNRVLEFLLASIVYHQ